VQRLLTEGHDAFLVESRDVLRAGLESAAWIPVDDTGARHKVANAFCTQVGNDDFIWFGTRASKSRLNFLELPCGGQAGYVVNQAAFAYMRQRGLSAATIDRLAAAKAKSFADREAWRAHLDQPGIWTRDKPGQALVQNPAHIATEGALWGCIQARGHLRGTVVLSDDAAQFAVGQHALCRGHAERLIHKPNTFTDHQRTAQQRIRSLIWAFYTSLKAYRANPDPHRRQAPRARFDHIFRRRTGFATLDRLLARPWANKAELLRVLDRPEGPLHTNGSENDVRCQVTRRKVSAGTRSDHGRDCRDAFLGLAKTRTRLGIAFWDYLASRPRVPAARVIQPLPELVRCRGQPA
jgi:hypothetical protein